MKSAYLTIDDSPSSETIKLVDFLDDANIDALFFCRGDRLEENPEPIIHAIKKGFIIGNHAYSHQRASTMSFIDMAGEIERTETLIEEAYTQAGKTRPAKYFRFPHMDRGCGGWIIDYDRLPEKHRETVIRLFSEGLNISLSPPHIEQVEKQARLQEYLKEEGFMRPFTNISHEWYKDTEIAEAIDTMFTFSTSDWMITKRHQGKWPYKNLDDLKEKIDSDPWLNLENSTNIILAHDQEGLLDITKELISHALYQEIEFKPIGPK
jgi:peptidoglycan/xylan/chitin deacetylase (PgdA/CDA1 family)